MKKSEFFFTVFFMFFSFLSFAQDEWVVPEKYNYSINPTIESNFHMLGKDLYTKYCQSCHGEKGHGDGTTLDKLGDNVCDFAVAKFQSQPDGVIFYKITFGRCDMPEHAKKLPDDIDRWLLVNYIRTLTEDGTNFKDSKIIN